MMHSMAEQLFLSARFFFSSFFLPSSVVALCVCVCVSYSRGSCLLCTSFFNPVLRPGFSYLIFISFLLFCFLVCGGDDDDGSGGDNYGGGCDSFGVAAEQQDEPREEYRTKKKK